MTALSTFCSTSPRVSRAAVARCDELGFAFGAFRLGVVTAGRAFFFEGALVAGAVGASWFGTAGSGASGDDGDVRAIRASETESAIKITFTATLTGRSAGASRRFR